MKKLLTAMMIALLCSPQLGAQGRKKQATTADPMQGRQKYTGFFDFYYDRQKGQIFLLVDKLDQEFLYVNSLAAGVGSNDIGLDRGQLDKTRVVKFVRSGPKLLLIQPNYHYRAITDNPAEKQAVQEAFAQSVLWGFKVEMTTDKGVLINITDFLLRDAHQVAGRLQQKGQGSYHVDRSRSALYLERTRAFPENVEFEAIITLVGKPQGDYIRSVTPTPQAVTVRQHHSFVKLPDDGYQPRRFDPRAGYFGISYVDYAAPLGQPIVQRFIARHRLQKKDPAAARSEPVKPIVYYLDPGVPEPVRSALLEGARWWNQAFEAAGYINAFRVEMLPEGADPLDVRYNVIQWVHRSTRGWSYGASVVDPRTGEIIKGHVSLGSLRVRQDFLIAVGLLSPYRSDKVPDTMKEMALARIRQLAAHEVGHTLGLAHNYSSSMDGRASVMDYPHPYITVKDGKLDFSQAYATGIGRWDKVSIAYGYQDFPEGTDESQALHQILLDAYQKQGLSFISDQDARPAGSAHPRAHLWDNSSDAASELLRVLQVREVALRQFGEAAVPVGQPLALLEEALVPVYFFHRYQTEAAVKVIGGLYYTYAIRGDGQVPVRLVPPAKQQAALEAVLATLSPDVLALREEVLQTIPPRPLGYKRHRETIKLRTGLTFDPLAAAEAAANMTVGLLLRPERASRLVEYHSRDASQPGLDYVLDKLLQATWYSRSLPGYKGQIRHVVNDVTLHHLLQLAGQDKATVQARAITWSKIKELEKRLQAQLTKATDADEQAALQYALRQIDLFTRNPDKSMAEEPLAPPPGSPIGSDFVY